MKTDGGDVSMMVVDVEKAVKPIYSNCVNCDSATMRFSRTRIVRGAKSEVYVCDVCGCNEEYLMKNNQ